VAEIMSVSEKLQRALRGLGLSFGFTFDNLVDALQTRSGRPLEFIPWQMPAVLSGVWLRGEKTDYIFHERTVATFHQTMIKLHELCHILLGHEPLTIEHEIASFLPTGHFPEGVAQALLRNGHHRSPEEAEAEQAATLLLDLLYPDRTDELFADRTLTGHVLEYMERLEYS
jgi:hypothetical protein